MRIRKTLFLLILAFAAISLVYAQVVDNQLGRSLRSIFPELNQGYIDLNDNGTKDMTVELEEQIPESRMKDSTIQVQEILNFIIENYRFIPLNSLYKVREALSGARGEIPELISLSYKNKIEVIIADKEELGEDGIYLTPSAYQRAMETMEGYIAGMALAYKQEGRGAENDFIRARNALFAMIEKGYPLPKDLNTEDEQVFEASMINTIIKEGESGQDKVKAAITTLGRMKSENAVPYIMQVFPKNQYKTECIQALGSIGSKGALDLLASEHGKSKDLKTQNDIILSMGRIGGNGSLAYILKLYKQSDENTLDPATEIAILQSFSYIAAAGSYDKQIFAIFEESLASPRPELRIVAVRGLSHFKAARTGELLFGLLKEEDNEDVVLSIIQAVNGIGSASTIPTFSALLRGVEISIKVRIEIISALSTNPQGSKALTFIVDNFNSSSEEVRDATAACMYRLYQADRKSTTGILARGLLSSKDEHYLKSGTAVLARIADPDSVNALYSLLQSPYPEVKKNVTWALYRVRAKANIRIADGLNKLVSSETEPLDVRINSVRALGAMGFDTPALKIWQTMVTTAKMRGENYSTLRRFAIRALGGLGNANEEIKQTLMIIASREKDPELKKEALSSLQKLAVVDVSVERSLADLAKQVDDVELKVQIVELLGDMGSPETVRPASEILEGNSRPSLKNRVIYALSRAGGADAYTAIIDAAADGDLREFVIAALESADREHMEPIISRRLKAENNKDITALLEFLQEEFSTQY